MTGPKRGLGGFARGEGWRTDVERITHREAGEFRRVTVGAIDPAPWQPRRHFDPAALQELAGSIVDRGVLEPLLVREGAGGRYELLAGERRLRAAREAGLAEVPVRVLVASDLEARLVTREENRSREDLTAWEDASELAAIRDAVQLERGHVTVRELAAAEGVSSGAVSEKLRIADHLTPAVLQQAEIDVQLLNTLPYRQLVTAAKAPSEVERAVCLRRAIFGRTPETRDAPERTRSVKPITILRGGGIRVEIRRPDRLEPEEARAVLDALASTLAMLRSCAGESAEARDL